MNHRTEETERELAAEAAGVPMMKDRPDKVCPQCGCDDCSRGHYDGPLGECSWYECAECEFRFGGDGPYCDAKPDPHFRDNDDKQSCHCADDNRPCFYCREQRRIERAQE